MSEEKPLFITFEGGEGSGKTTQCNLFYNWFKEFYDGSAIKVREPGGVIISEKIREILLDNTNKNMDNLTELFLFEAARSQFMRELINPSLSKGISIISDRFYDSTIAYQGYGRDMQVEFIEILNLKTVKGNHPDLTFIIDVDPEIGLANRLNGGNVNRIDSETFDFHKRVNEGFREIAKLNPGRCVLIPYENGIVNVQNKIIREFNQRYFK